MFTGIDLSSVKWSHKNGNGKRISTYSKDIYIQRYRTKDGEKKRYCIYVYNNKGDHFKTERVQFGVIGNLLLLRDSEDGFKLSPKKTLQMGTRTMTFIEGNVALDKWLDGHLHQAFDLEYDSANDIYYVQG